MFYFVWSFIENQKVGRFKLIFRGYFIAEETELHHFHFSFAPKEISIKRWKLNSDQNENHSLKSFSSNFHEKVFLF